MDITIFTVTFNEEFHMQYMINHYRKNFPNCKIVVYDNYSTDNTVNICKNNNVEVIFFDTNSKFSDTKHIEIKNNCWKNSNSSWILTCDTDELLDINESQLYEEELLGTSIIRFEGYNMVNLEGDSTLETIKYGARAVAYDKPYLFNKNHIKEINYSVGCHSCNPIGNIILSKNIYKAYHYRFINLELTLNRCALYGKRLSDENIKNGWGLHYLKKSKEIEEEYSMLRSKAIKLLD